MKPNERTPIMKLRFYFGVFFVTAATLMLQVIQTRILSLVAWYHLAFFVISTAMFGLTVGAVWVYLRGDRFSEKTLSHDLAYFSAAFAITTALSLAVQMTLSPIALPTVTTLIVWFELALCLSIPFFFAGVIVSLVLTRSPYPVGLVYGVDLVGAAIGCIGVLFLLNLTDGPSAVLWVSAIAALAANFFAGSGIGTRPQTKQPFSRLVDFRGLLFLVLAGCAIANGLDQKQNGIRPIFVKGKMELLSKRPLFEQWNSFSRIAVYPADSKSPSMWGPSPRFSVDDWAVDQRGMNIDGDAATVAYGIHGDVARAKFLEYDVTNLGYFLPGHKRAAIIGVGGGRDMLSARVFGVPDITGVEINPIFIDLLAGNSGFSEFTGINKLDGMHFVVDEARSWFARSTESFDVIQMSLIDTWAATGAGAFTLSENGLYTTEAWQIFLRRLTRDGIFTVSRWYSPAHVNETGRMISLAVAALMEEGAEDPRKHIFLASSEHIATLILSRSPFSQNDLGTLERIAEEMKFNILIRPNREPASKVLTNILTSNNRNELDLYGSSLSLDLTPPTDQRPFFFNQLPFYNAGKVLALALSGRSPGIGYGNLFATVTLIILFVVSFTLVVVAIVVPLRNAISDVGRTLVIGGTAYFFLIGVGFMMIEIGLLQRLSIFLGHPIYSLSIVLFSMIFMTGIGSIISHRLPLDNTTKFTFWSGLIGVYLLSLAVWLPDVLISFNSSRLLVRALVCVLVILPAGLLMGFGFPTGMRLISEVDRKPTPWFWGINGASGVLASAAAVACSIAYGIGTTLTVGATCYLLLVPAALIIGFRRIPMAIA